MMESSGQPTNDRGWSWILGLVLILLGGLFLVNQLFIPMDEMIWAVAMAGIGATFLAVFATSKERWWALIPAYVFGAVAALIVLTTVPFLDNWIAIYVMAAIALPFYYVYVRNRENWWALIPAYVMTAVGGLIFLEDVLSFGRIDLAGPYVMFAIALPFFVVFVRNPKNWWALIPAGIMAVIGTGLLVSEFTYLVPAALIVAGIYLLVRYGMGVGNGAAEPTGSIPASGPEADRAPEPIGEHPASGPEADHA
jgi:hypothetical protein